MGDIREFSVQIITAAAKHGIPYSTVGGIIRQESGAEPLACRHEPGYRWLYYPERVKPVTCSLTTEKIFQMTSWGLMQVMGAVYREYGFEGWLSKVICDIEAQLEYGCLHLGKKIKKFGLEGGIVAYNSGSPRRKEDGTYVNQYYLDAVLRYTEEVNF